MSIVKYRGISNAVRRAINNGSLTGEIHPDKVRSLLPETKRNAPDNVIVTSLKRLADMHEIKEVGSRYFVKNQAPGTPLLQRMCVIGGLISTTVQDGKCIVTLDVETMNPYNGV